MADVLRSPDAEPVLHVREGPKAVSVCTPAYYADVVCKRARCYLSGVYDTLTQSAAGSVGVQLAAVVNDDVLIHARLRDTVFYI